MFVHLGERAPLGMRRTPKPSEAKRMGPRAKPPAGDTQAIVNVALDVGDWLDVMDAEGTWNVAQVLRVINSKEVEVKYDGWGTEYNEVVVLNSDRVAPYHTYTWSVVCWAKYKNWPWWPSIVTIRSPGTLAGQQYLANEKRLFVDFMDGKDITKRCRCWVEQSKVQPFSKLEDERRKRSTGSDFEASLARVHLSSAIKTFPKFAKGTLPMQYRSEIATPVSVLKKEGGLRQWAKSVISNRERHRRVYMYKFAGGVPLTDDEDDDGDEGQIVQFVDFSDNDEDAPKKPRASSKGKAPTRSKAVKKEHANSKYVESVVEIEGSVEIIEGLHAPSPKREPEEQPLFLPPIDEQIGAGVVPSHCDEGIGQQRPPRQGAHTSISSPSDVPASRKRARQEPTETSSIDAIQVYETTAGRDEEDDVTNDHGDDSAFEPGTTSVEENSEETMAIGPFAESRDPTLREACDQALVMDIDKNDDSDAESDLIPLDPVEDVSVEPVPDSASVMQPSHMEVFGASAASQQICSTQAPEVTPIVETQDPATGNVAELPHEVQTVGALVTRQETSQTEDVVLPPTLQVEVMTAPLKPSKSTRKSSKSLADESIAAALAELDDKPARNKKARTDTGGKTSTSDSKMKSPQVTPSSFNAADASSKGPMDTVMPTGAPPTQLTKTSPQPPPATETALSQDARGTLRRSRMRADVEGADSTPGEGQRKLKGKTPVWVLPPPKFDASAVYGSSPVSTTSILSAPPFPPPLSSLSLFGSTVDFSMRKWFKEDKYPHYLSHCIHHKQANECSCFRYGTGNNEKMNSTMHGADSEGDSGDERKQRPMYAARPPPLVQPLQLSSFSEKTMKRYGTQDLAYEWVALFQTIGGGHRERSATSRSLKTSMKMNVPDTIFLSPTGQPSVWYTTASSKHVTARHLAHVTPRSVVDSLRPKQSQHDQRCAIVYKGFEAQVIDAAQLQELASQMEHACIRSPTRERLDSGDDDSVDDLPVEDDNSDLIESESALKVREHEAAVFCVQQYIQRAHDVSYLSLWRQHTVQMVPDTTPQSLGSNPKSPTVRAVDDIFLVARNDGMEHVTAERRDSKEAISFENSIKLRRLALGGVDDSRTRKVLEDVGFDAEAVVPLLLHMKLLTSEIVSRINRACGSSRQVQSLACEFFLSPDNAPPTHAGVAYNVYFSALAGIQWQGSPASWETLCEVDRMSRSISEYVSAHPRTTSRSPSRRKRSDADQGSASRSRGIENNFALALFDELNPRFPSVQPLSVAEKQWKSKTSLLPPHVSPRYVESEIPKVYRDGQFQPMLTPGQCHSVNRLNATASGFARVDAPRHPLSKKHAQIEQALWLRQDQERVARGLSPRSPIKMSSLKPPTRAFTTPRSPRHRHSLIKEELV